MIRHLFNLSVKRIATVEPSRERDRVLGETLHSMCTQNIPEWHVSLEMVNRAIRQVRKMANFDPEEDIDEDLDEDLDEDFEWLKYDKAGGVTRTAGELLSAVVEQCEQSRLKGLSYGHKTTNTYAKKAFNTHGARLARRVTALDECTLIAAAVKVSFQPYNRSCRATEGLL